MPFDDRLQEFLDALDARDRRRTLLRLDAPTGPWTQEGSRRLVNLCSNDYLSLAGDPRLAKAAAEAAERYGAGSGASRLITGNLPIHEELEAEAARFTGREAALLFGSGYHANTGVLPALAGEGDVIFSDELNHASLIDGCRLSNAACVVFRHADLNHLNELLAAHRDTARDMFIVTESIFSMDGDAPDFAGLAELRARYGAVLLVDEAHALGVAGPDGGGLANEADVVVGTFGKAFGSFGAFVAGSARLRDALLNRARTAIYSTALPPASAAASLAALRIVLDEGAETIGKLRRNVMALVRAVRGAGFGAGIPAGAIIPVVIGGEREALRASEVLKDHGVLARAIRPPSVPPGTCRIRLTACAGHSPADLEIVAAALEQVS